MPVSPRIRTALSILVCIASTVPSFVLGLLVGAPVWAMALPALAFALSFMAVTRSQRATRLLWNPAARRACGVVVLCRTAATALFPVGWTNDALIGIVVFELLDTLPGVPLSRGNLRSGPALIATLAQGAALLLEMLLLGVVAYGVARMLGAPVVDPRRSAFLCGRCGYDVRGSREFGRCPECGTAFEPARPAGPAAGLPDV